MVIEASAERIYSLVAEDEDARLCRDISEAACREVPGNFLRILISQVLTGIGDLLASPKLVLTWLLGALGAPAALIGALVPVREAGALLPQLVLGAWVRRHPRRAGFWILGSVLQAGCVAGMAAAAWSLEGAPAGWTVLALLTLFALARGLCSVAMKDVQGKCVPRNRRGRLGGLAAGTAGVGVSVLGALMFGGYLAPGVALYSALLLVAAALWLLAAANFARVEEFAGETAGGRDIFAALADNAGLLFNDAPLRSFVITRALLMGSALAAPFFVLLAQRGGPDPRLLGALLVASSLASSVSATVWGWMADSSSRHVMMLRGAIAAAVCLLAAAVGWVFGDSPLLGWLIAASYFVLSIAHAGIRIGRKTYLVDMTDGTRRTDYVAVSNSAIGIALIAVGAVCGWIASASIEAALALFGAMGLAGVASAYTLREV